MFRVNEFMLKGQNLITKLVVTLSYNLTKYLFIGNNSDKSTIELHLLLISSMLTKFLEN